MTQDDMPTSQDMRFRVPQALSFLIAVAALIRDTCAPAADQPQSLSVIGTQIRRVP
jgi:hypothetical protein